jgi:two-component system, cell cycle response regulator
MDPLVRVAIGMQRALAATNGTLLALAAGFALVRYRQEQEVAYVAVCVVVLGSFALRLRGRLRDGAEPTARRDAELGLHAAVLGYAAVSSAPSGITGPYHSLVYVVLCIASGVGTLPAVAAIVVMMVALELGFAAEAMMPTSQTVAHLVVLPLFAGLNWVVFRGEVARVRRASAEKVRSELSRMREAARSYRFGDAVRSSAAQEEWQGSTDPIDERLLQSSVEQLHVSLRLVLTLLRGALGLRTAALMWRAEHQLFVREVSTDHKALVSGPFDLDRGIVAAAFSTEKPVWVPEAKSLGRMPIYPHELPSGDLSVYPIFDVKNPLGALLLDAMPGRTLDATILPLVEETARFAQRAIENERLFLAVQRTKEEQGKLYRAANLLAKARTEAEVIRAGVDAARSFTRFEFAAVTLYHEANHTHEICAVSGHGTEHLVGGTFEGNHGLVSMVVANRVVLPYRGEYNPERQMVFSDDLATPDLASLIILPLYVHDTDLGALLLGSQEPGAFGEDVLPLLEVLSRHVSVSLANARMVKRLEDLATTDGLTGLLNKRALTEMAHHKIRSSQRFSKPLSVIIGDIDHFKKVNDTYGHDIGDVVIKGFGNILKRTKRETDAVGRFGGEEFVLVCEETDATGARLLAERIRQELEATQFHTPQGTLQVTCSLGVATFPLAGQDWTALFKATDEALYVSKRKGRNRVSVWAPGMSEAA